MTTPNQKRSYIDKDFQFETSTRRPSASKYRPRYDTHKGKEYNLEFGTKHRSLLQKDTGKIFTEGRCVETQMQKEHLQVAVHQPERERRSVQKNEKRLLFTSNSAVAVKDNEIKEDDKEIHICEAPSVENKDILHLRVQIEQCYKVIQDVLGEIKPLKESQMMQSKLYSQLSQNFMQLKAHIPENYIVEIENKTSLIECKIEELLNRKRKKEKLKDEYVKLQEKLDLISLEKEEKEKNLTELIVTNNECLEEKHNLTKKLDEQVNKYIKFEKEIDDYKENFRQSNLEVEELKKEKKNLEQNVNSLHDQIQRQKEEWKENEKEFQNTIDGLKEELTRTKRSKTELYNSFNTEKRSSEQEYLNLMEKMKIDKNERIKEINKTLDGTVELVNKLTDELNAKKEETHQMNITIEKLKREKEEMQNEKIALQQKIKDLLEKIQQCKKLHENDNNTHKQRVEELNHRNMELVDQNKNLKSCFTVSDETVKDLQIQLQMSKEEQEKLQTKIKDLENEKGHFETKRKKQISLTVCNQIKQSLLDVLIRELNTHLQRLLRDGELRIKVQQDLTRSKQSGPFLVACISMSRLRADVQEAIKGLEVNADTALVILHHKEEHALPQLSSGQILTGMPFSNLGAIIDLALVPSKGLYECSMNNDGLNKLVTFLKRF